MCNFNTKYGIHDVMGPRFDRRGEEDVFVGRRRTRFSNPCRRWFGIDTGLDLYATSTTTYHQPPVVLFNQLAPAYTLVNTHKHSLTMSPPSIETIEQNKLLIAEVRKHRILYIMGHPRDEDMVIRADIWKRIAEKLQMTGK